MSSKRRSRRSGRLKFAAEPGPFLTAWLPVPALGGMEPSELLYLSRGLPGNARYTLARAVEPQVLLIGEVTVDLGEDGAARARLVRMLSEGGGGLSIKVREGLDASEATEDVERVVDSLQDLPEEAERITVKVQEVRLPVIRVALYGDMDEDVRKRAIRQVRDDLQTLPGMGEVLVEGTRDYEIRVDVRGRALVKHGISLPEVADAVGAWMAEVPGGTVRGTSGNVKVRTMGVA